MGCGTPLPVASPGGRSRAAEYRIPWHPTPIAYATGLRALLQRGHPNARIGGHVGLTSVPLWFIRSPCDPRSTSAEADLTTAPAHQSSVPRHALVISSTDSSAAI